MTQLIQPDVGTSLVPADISDHVDLTMWANALVNHTPYEDPDPEYLSRRILMETLTATTAEAVFAQSQGRKLQEWVPDFPGAYVGPLEITELTVTGSDFGEGATCYVIIAGEDLTDGTSFRASTGATGVQAQLLRLVSLGTWPLRCVVKRTESKDKGGRYLLRLWPPD